MRLIHFDILKPICPACKANSVRICLELVIDKEIEGNVTSGLLRCPAPSCRRSYPILFGCPVLVPDISAWLTANLHLVLQRDIDSENVENLIGEAISADSAFNITRQQQSSYCADHYRQEFTNLSSSDIPENEASTIRKCLGEILNTMRKNSLPCIDLGCAVGGTTFDIAKNRNAITLGIDLNWPLINIARKALDKKIISYPHRIIGNKYRRRSAALSYGHADLCDFWVADALCLPFEIDTFGLAIALNLIDCLPTPQELLSNLLDIVCIGGGISLSCPFDWVSHATNQTNWIYGGEELDDLITRYKISYKHDQKKMFSQLNPPRNINWSLPLHEHAKINYESRLYKMQASLG